MSQVIDLSRPLEPGMPHARTIPAAEFTQVRTWGEHRMRAMRLDLPTHIGTHLDAPSHFVEDGTTIDQVPPSALVGRAYCAEILRAGPDPVTAADLKSIVDIQPGDALLIRTGWDDRYGDPEYVDRHPYLTVDAAEWVVAQGLRLVGTDTITPEYPMGLRPPDYHHDVHGTLLGAGTLIVENLVLREIADRWVTLFLGALNVLGGDGAPARALAVWSGE
ncbi:cyclase family protein [Amycolatopsis pithecellobii]|uniref:Cyclase family protein n=1 Tax=Amycolatopsis pithecellobii TaxID=664692 RepID=A0A6N7Z373_9PSEU|nr:cyclase family protein [Amycolatopsis pithecellobii]MTD53306.1 cyclase family protein [Amycolatopsis pithecellobii]